MVHVSATIIESIQNNSYSIHVIIMIEACCILFPTNIWVAGQYKMVFGNMHIYVINICMLNWFQIIYVDAISLITETEGMFMSM